MAWGEDDWSADSPSGSWSDEVSFSAVALRRVLQSAGLAEALSGVDLFLLALVTADRASLSVEMAIALLVANGMAKPKNRARLAHKITQSTRDTSGFTPAGEGFHLASGAVRDRLLAILWRQPEMQRRAASPVAQAIASLKAMQALASGPDRVGTRLTAARAPAPTAISLAPPASPPACDPPPGPWRTVPPVIGRLSIDALRAALACPPVSLSAVSLTVRAHALAAAESFEDLLAPPQLVGVQSHAYQLETVRRVLRLLRGRALLADEVGLGKTVEAMITLREYQLRGMVRRALIVTPGPLVRMWEAELAAKTGVSARTTEDPAFNDDPESFFRGEGVVIASLSRIRTARHAPIAQAEPWDMVIVDEAHHIKNRTTLGHKLVNGLQSRFLLLLTATPVETDLEEIYNLITLLKPGQFATPAAFRKEYIDPKEPTSPKNRERLRALLGEVMVRNTRAQCGLKLPPRFVTTVIVDPSSEEKALYFGVVALMRAFAHEGKARLATSTLLLEAGSSMAAARATLVKIAQGDKHGAAFRQAVAGLAELAREKGPSRKSERLVELVRTHGGHALVFTRFRESQAAVCDALYAAGLRFESFHGGMTSAEKQAALQRFRDQKCVLVATDVGGEGQNLQFCSLLVNYDLPWNPMLIEQRIGRLHRMGQTEEVRVFNLCAKGTAEEQLLDVLDRRVHLFELVVGEMDMVLGNVASEDDLETRILSLYAEAANDSEIAHGFDALADELLAARGRYDHTKALDQALFGEDYEA